MQHHATLLSSYNYAILYYQFYKIRNKQLSDVPWNSWGTGISKKNGSVVHYL